MPVTPVQSSGAIPLMNAAGTAGVNTAANYRQGLIGAFTAPAPGAPQSWRPGVLPTQMTSGAYADLRVAQTSTASAQVAVAAGNCVVVRSGASGGPYLVNFNSTSTLTTDGANTTNPRIDVLYCQVTDVSGLGDSGTVGGQLAIVDGTPAASPVAPAVPAGAVPIAQLYRPTVAGGGNTVLSSNITDVRKGAGCYGGMRPLMAGDALADAGSYIGEMTHDGITARLAGPRYWDGTQWRGMVSAHYSAVLANAVSTVANTYQVLLTISLADPGWPYLVQVSGATLALNAAAANAAPFAWITLDSTVGNSGVIIGGVNGNGGVEDTTVTLPAFTWGTTLTGAHTIRLIGDTNVGSAWAGQNSGSATVTPTWLNVDVYPF